MIVYTRQALAKQIEEHGWSVGEFTYGIPLVWAHGNDGGLSIGRYCSFSFDVTILLGGNHRMDWVTTYPFTIIDDEAKHIVGHPQARGDVVIGNDVWIGHGCLILSGVSIGDGACLAAKSVITKDVPPYSIAAGHPAKVLRKRFTDDQIAALQEIAWWNWDRAKIRQAFDLLLSEGIDTFIAQHRVPA